MLELGSWVTAPFLKLTEHASAAILLSVALQMHSLQSRPTAQVSTAATHLQDTPATV